MDAAHHRPGGHPEDPADLVVGEAVDVAEAHGEAEGLRDFFDGLQDFLRRQAAEEGVGDVRGQTIRTSGLSKPWRTSGGG